MKMSSIPIKYLYIIDVSLLLIALKNAIYFWLWKFPHILNFDFCFVGFLLYVDFSYIL